MIAAYPLAMIAAQHNLPLLAIDTAGPRLQLALAAAGGIDVLCEDIARGHAEILFERIQKLLARNGLTYDDLARLAVTVGPGAFTGLRIGLSAARGLRLALAVPLVGVPTLTAMSLSGAPGAPLAVFLDARRNEAYVQAFSRPGCPDGAAAVLPHEAARAFCAERGAVLEPAFCDIARLAEFGASADPAAFPPEPFYIRPADAKPQTGAGIARVSEAAK